MIAYLQAHPLLAGLLGLVLVLAVVGLWYVLVHHLKMILITLICILGAAAGVVVFWRGIGNDMTDLIVIGTFLMVVFPVIYGQAIRRERRLIRVPGTQIPGLVKTATGGSPPRR